MAVDILEMVLDGALATGVVGTEPGGVPLRLARDVRKVIGGLTGIILGITSSELEV